MVGMSLFIVAGVASAVDIHGTLQVGGAWGDGYANANLDDADLFLSGKDDTTTVTFEFEHSDIADGAGLPGVTMSALYATTDWTTLFSLDDIVLGSEFGYGSAGLGDNVCVTYYGLEEPSGIGTSTVDSVYGIVRTGYRFEGGVAGLSLASPVDTYDEVNDEGFGDFLVGMDAAYGPVYAEWYYGADTEEFGIEGSYSGKYALSSSSGMILGFNAAAFFKTDLSDDVLPGSEQAYGLGVSGSLAGATVGLSMNGNDDVALDGYALDAQYAILDTVTSYLGLLFSGDEDTDAFQGADISFGFDGGATDVYVGYVVTETGAGGLNNVATIPTDGGAYMTITYSF